MLTLLRKIRRSMLENDANSSNERTQSKSRYFLYAIGEIILVVLGILIALQINNWNERNKSIAAKNQYCEQLIEALQSDVVNLEDFGKRIQFIDQGGMYIWEFVNGQRTEIDTNLFKNYFLNAANSFDFTPLTTSYDNLVANGGLNLIKNDSLKTYFSTYYLPQRGNEEITQQRINYSAAYNDMRFQFVSPMMLKKFLNGIFNNSELTENIRVSDFDDKILMQEIDLSEFDVQWKFLKESQEFKVLLGRMLAIREPHIDNIRNTKRQVHRMIELLKEEIE